MIVVFGEEPPVFSRPTTQPYQAFQAAGTPNRKWPRHNDFFLITVASQTHGSGLDSEFFCVHVCLLYLVFHLGLTLKLTGCSKLPQCVRECAVLVTDGRFGWLQMSVFLLLIHQVTLLACLKKILLHCLLWYMCYKISLLWIDAFLYLAFRERSDINCRSTGKKKQKFPRDDTSYNVLL